MQINLLCVSKPIRGWAQQACSEYEKRLQGLINFRVKEIQPVALAKSQSKSGTTQNKVKEAQALLAATPKHSTQIALDEVGKQLTTREFADQLQQLRLAGRDVAFYIGGADGLDDSVQARCAQRISLSNMTLPHQIARLVFTEQIYRALSLLNNHPYHRDG